jgi:hypothetical protein
MLFKKNSFIKLYELQKRNVEEIFHDKNYGMAFDILKESQTKENFFAKD